jgi:hypothetical protein
MSKNKPVTIYPSNAYPKPVHVLEGDGAITVDIPRAVWDKIQTYVTLCDEEINGFGYVSQLSETRLRIDNVFILKQEVTSTSVTTDDEALAEFTYQLHCKNKEREAAGEKPLMVRLHWHSHVNLDAFWSTQDESTINANLSEWNLSIVTNKRNEYAARLDLYRPFRVKIDAELHVIEANTFREDCRKEIDALVSKKVFSWGYGNVGHVGVRTAYTESHCSSSVPAQSKYAAKGV